MPNFQVVDPLTEKLRQAGGEELKSLLDKASVTTDPLQSNRLMGNVLIILTEKLGFTNAQAYRLVRPNHRASDESAAVIVSKRKAWYRSKYPLTISEAMEMSGLTIEHVVLYVKEMIERPQLMWDNEKQRYVESGHFDVQSRNLGLNQLHKLIALDDEAKEHAAIGKKQQQVQLDLPPKAASIHEWEEWAKAQEKIVLEERTKAAEEMKLIAEGQRAMREQGKDAVATDE